MMNIILMGPPGSGKGTQAEMICKDYKIAHIATGDIIRENIKNETALGKVAKEYVESGKLVPDDLIIRIIRKRLSNPDSKTGYLLDGFPRTTYQALELDKITKIQFAISLDVPDKLVVTRISRRRVCKCGSSYHIDFKPSERDGLCDKCGGELYQREDDKEDTIKSRLEVYRKQTEPLIEFYKKKHVLHIMDGSLSIGEVFEQIKKILDA